MAYADELLDGFKEAVGDFGTTITVLESGMVVPVVAVFPEASNNTESAGYQPKGAFNFEVRRTDAADAGIGEDALFTIADASQRMRVDEVEDDPASSLLYVSGVVNQ